MAINLNGNELSTFSAHIRSENTGSSSSGQGRVVGYQQGDWTPTYSDNSSNAITGVNEVDNACWSRIGNQVTAWTRLTVTSTDDNFAVGNRIALTGLPYDVEDASSLSGGASVASAGNTRYAVFFDTLTNNTNEVRSTCFRLEGTVAVTTAFILTVTYLTDDTTWTPNTGATVS